MRSFENSLAFAQKLDRVDPLRDFKSLFYIPQIKGKEVVYFCGNSLGLEPKGASEYINQELTDWAQLGVEGHIHAKKPWVTYHKPLSHALAEILGAKPIEVVAMNSLTVNLHLLMTSFYRPTKKKYKILIEYGAFSSDQYAVESQVMLHGLNPNDAIIEVAPEEGEFLIKTEAFLEAIEKHSEDLALIILGGVNYYTGQVFDMEAITKAAHKANVIVGLDLAHAVGNVPLKLHDWDVDFAVWCSYKYLNSGPGGVGGLFVHERYANDSNLHRHAGWWGHREDERFLMKKGFQPMQGAEGWQLSNAPVVSMAVHAASLEIFQKAGMGALIKKSKMLTNFLEFMLKSPRDPSERSIENAYMIRIITPENEDERGCQLSIRVKDNCRKLLEEFIEAGFIVDWRSPSVIRVTPVPLYNSFQEVYLFGKFLREISVYEYDK